MDPVESQLADHIDIPTSGFLFRVVDDLKEFVSKGLLIEVEGTCFLSEIVKGNPFPDDLIWIYFETISGETRYMLNCDTYRGLGGVFKKLGPDEPSKIPDFFTVQIALKMAYEDFS